VEAAIAAGARALTGGAAPEGPGFFFPPTVLVDVTDDMEVMCEETFGPVLPMVAVADLEEGIRRANDSRFGLTASGWTRSRATAQRLQQELHAGVVSINDHAVPFGETTGAWGGVGESGIGRAHGEFGLHELVNVKYVIRDPGGDEAMPWYYPYDEDFDRFLDAALPMLYGRGLGRFATSGRLMMTKRFRERVRKGTLLANLDKLL
jgi:delta 1-pyrroline-5-carboxylate dehydrogenase